MTIQKITIDLEEVYGKGGNAILAEISVYIHKAKDLAGNGNDITLTGKAPVWLYLKVAHELHGLATRMAYTSPVSGDVEIFNHSPF